jgi:hypothetical protein
MTKTRRHLLETTGTPVRERPELHLKRTVKKRPANKWTEKEYSTLVSLVRQIGEDWNRIASTLENKTAKQCMQKFKNSQRSAKKGNWTSQEDELLFSWVERHGPTKWTECSKEIKGRCGKQCRERWVNILNPDVKKGNWSDHEQDVIFESLSTYNTSWSAMSHELPGRTENSIKNYFYSSVRRLKSNNLFHHIKALYLYKKMTCLELMAGNSSISNDVSKLNRLSQKICNFLFTPGPKNEQFLTFLLSVLFGPDVPTAAIEAENKKPELSKGFVPLGQRNLFVPTDKLDVGGKTGTGVDPKVVLEAMRLLESNPEFSKMAPLLKMLENELPRSQITQFGKKTEVRLSTCWNCKGNICPHHQEAQSRQD